MKYCSNCGKQANNSDAKFCEFCGTPFSHDTASNIEQTDEKHVASNVTDKKKNILPVAIVSVIVVALVGLLLSGVFHAQEPTLSLCEELLSSSVDDLLENDDFEINDSFDIIMGTASTAKIYGVSGEIVVFALDDEEYINLVTWQSLPDVTLTASEIEGFVHGMVKNYGEPTKSTDEMYFWENDQSEVILETEDNEIYILFAKNE